MIVNRNPTDKPKIVEETTILRNNSELKMLDDLQELLYQLEESNFEETIEKMDQIDLPAIIVAENFNIYSYFDRKKISLFVRLIFRLKSKNEIIEKIIMLQNLGKGMRIFSHFFRELVNIGLISRIHKPKKITDDKNISSDDRLLKTVIMKDDIEQLKVIFTQPTFDINQVHQFLEKPTLTNNRSQNTLIEFSAFCGSIKCFRFLYINGARLIRDQLSIMKFAIMGGNVEIIQILEQSHIQVDKTCIRYAIHYHRKEIFDWLLEQFPESHNDITLSKICFEDEFIHGIFVFEKFDLKVALENSVRFGLVSLAKDLLSRYSIEENSIKEALLCHGIYSACQTNDIEMVKVLFSVPYYEFYQKGVFFILLYIWALYIRAKKVTLSLLN